MICMLGRVVAPDTPVFPAAAILARNWRAVGRNVAPGAERCVEQVAEADRVDAGWSVRQAQPAIRVASLCIARGCHRLDDLLNDLDCLTLRQCIAVAVVLTRPRGDWVVRIVPLHSSGSLWWYPSSGRSTYWAHHRSR